MVRVDGIPDGHLEIGHVRRAHGLRGEVFVQLVTDRTERLDVGSVLRTERGELTVTASRLLPNGRWVVQFAEIGDRTAAERWNNVALFGTPIEDADTFWVHELIGSRVVEVDGTDRGACVGIVANPASDLIELASGALVPMVFVRSLVDGVITVDVPDGLFELRDDA